MFSQLNNKKYFTWTNKINLFKKNQKMMIFKIKYRFRQNMKAYNSYAKIIYIYSRKTIINLMKII